MTLPGIIEVFADRDTALENVTAQETPNKFIQNGALYIQANNVIYNVLGTPVE